MSAAAALLALTLAGAPCFAPADQSPGWKRVLLPREAPALAAPEGVWQFRTAEPALLLQRNGPAFAGAHSPHLGRLEFTFLLPEESRRLELQFTKELRGAKVDASVYAGARSLPLLHEKRVGGDALTLNWELPRADRVTVSVHHHFREPPSLRQWTIAHLSVLAQEERGPLTAVTNRSLYFLHPGHRTLTLCQAPGQLLTVDAAALQGSAEPTVLNSAR